MKCGGQVNTGVTFTATGEQHEYIAELEGRLEERANANDHRRRSGVRLSGARFYLMVAGKRVAVDITTLKRRGTGQGNAAKQVTETALRILVGMPFPRSTVICA